MPEKQKHEITNMMRIHYLKVTLVYWIEIMSSLNIVTHLPPQIYCFNLKISKQQLRTLIVGLLRSQNVN